MTFQPGDLFDEVADGPSLPRPPLSKLAREMMFAAYAGEAVRLAKGGNRYQAQAVMSKAEEYLDD